MLDMSVFLGGDPSCWVYGQENAVPSCLVPPGDVLAVAVVVLNSRGRVGARRLGEDFRLQKFRLDQARCVLGLPLHRRAEHDHLAHALRDGAGPSPCVVAAEAPWLVLQTLCLLQLLWSQKGPDFWHQWTCCFRLT